MREQDRRSQVVAQQLNFSGGVQEFLGAYQIGDTYIAKGENCETRRGRLEKRKGFDDFLTVSPGALTPNVNGILRAYGGTNGAQTVVSFTNGSMYRLTGTTLTKITNAQGDVHTSAPSFVVWKQAMYVVSSAHALMQKWDLSNAGTLANTQVGTAGHRFLKLWPQANIIMLGGSLTVGKQSRVDFSDLGDPITFSTNNFFNIPEDMTGDFVQGFGVMPGGEMLILGTKTLNLLYGRVRGDFYLRTVDWMHGCTAPYSIVETPLGVFYKGRDAFYLYDGGPSAEDVSDAIEDTFNDMGDDASVVASLIDFNRVMISYKKDSSSSVNDRILIYNLPGAGRPQGSWDGPWTYGVNGITWLNHDSDAGQIFAVGTGTTQQLRQLEQGYDDGGTGYGIDFQSKEWYIQFDPQAELMELMTSADVSEGAYLKNQVKVDGLAWEDLDSAVPLSSTGFYEQDRDRTIVQRGRVDAPQILQIASRRTGRTVQLRIRSSRDKNALKIRGYTISAKSRNA